MKTNWLESGSGTIVTTIQNNGLFWQISPNSIGGFNISCHDKKFRFGILEKSIFPSQEAAKKEIESIKYNSIDYFIKSK